MIFYDLENFKKSLESRDRDRFYQFSRVHYTLVSLLKSVVQIDCNIQDLVRAYAYTGEFTDDIIKKMEFDVRNCSNSQEKEHRESYLAKIRKQMEGQQKFIKKAMFFNYFELRMCPLKYENGRIFQKGVDVQLAVDFVSHAYKDNFDIAVLCTGDTDLLESLKLVKSLGKKVVVVGSPTCSNEIRREADFFLNLAELPDEILDDFSRMYQN